MVALAKKLILEPRMSLRKVAARLGAQGHLTKDGKPYAATAVARIIAA